ncbi:MAG: hypothetical protein ACE367_11970 [Acidimicrobiales bacterium]
MNVTPAGSGVSTKTLAFPAVALSGSLVQRFSLNASPLSTV